MNKNILLSIIIVNYNGMNYLNNCISSIYENFTTFNFEIILVDNNSSDSSILFIEGKFPKVLIIKNKENIGFSKANNIGVKKSKGNFILFLNNDTIILNNIEKCFDLFKEYENIGIIGIQMLDSNKKEINSGGKFPNPINLFKLSLMFYNQKIKNQKIFYMDWVSGSFMLIRKEIYIKINGFDEDYFMYVEDIDLCKKIQNLNLKIIIITDLRYIHFIGFNKSMNNQIIKGLNIFINKYYFGFYKIMCLISLNINKLVKKFK